MSTDSVLYIGLMSGTSADGVDAVLADFSNDTAHIRQSIHLPFSDDLKQTIIALNSPANNELEHMCDTSQAVTQCYSDAIKKLQTAASISPKQVRAVGMHGQTIRHRPDIKYSLQIGNAALLAEQIGIDVVSDFRSRDLAAGGQGAPLTPAFHQYLWHNLAPCAVLNIGGFANVTLLRVGEANQTIGFDTGPGNVLLDGWIHHNKAQAYDDQGQWAASGTCHAELLTRCLQHPFFHQPAPKSTGRDDFHFEWLEQQLQGYTIAACDVQATLLELTARSIAEQIDVQDYPVLIVCGGGRHNTALMNRLQGLLPGCRVMGSDHIGMSPDYLEACAFAWLASRCIHRLSGNLPSVTGARGTRILGAIHQA